MPSDEMNVLHSEEAIDTDGKPTTHFLNGAHSNDIADVSATAAVTATATATANLTAYWGQQIAFKDIVKGGRAREEVGRKLRPSGWVHDGVGQLQRHALLVQQIADDGGDLRWCGTRFWAFPILC